MSTSLFCVEMIPHSNRRDIAETRPTVSNPVLSGARVNPLMQLHRPPQYAQAQIFAS